VGIIYNICGKLAKLMHVLMYECISAYMHILYKVRGKRDRKTRAKGKKEGKSDGALWFHAESFAGISGSLQNGG